MTRRDVLMSGGLAFAPKEGPTAQAERLIEERVRSGEVAAAVLHFREGSRTYERAFGKASTPEAVFLIASITKPMTATAVMLLSDRGKLRLTDAVSRFLPEFRGEGREAVQIRHLLSHTSGLPDMLPENEDLRRRHAPLQAFVEGTCRTPLLFPPGTKTRYQSMGILLAAEIVARISGQPLPALLRAEVFAPLGMHKTSLGLGGRSIAATMQSQVPEASDWDWNSAYWRSLASPWGGAHSTVGDISRFLRSFVQRGQKGVLRPETAASMIVNQNGTVDRPWGYGWMVGAAGFGRGCSERTFGHSGSTGTLCWHDPARDRTFVLLNTKPAEVSGKTLLRPVSELLSQ